MNKMQLGDSIEIVEGFLYIAYTRNTGAAWGIFGEHTEYLAIFSVVASLVLVYVLLHMKRGFGALSLAIVIGGAVGNAIDRIQLGWVVDFIDTYIFGYDFPTFNIADSAIVIGAFLLIIVFYKAEKDLKKGPVA